MKLTGVCGTEFTWGVFGSVNRVMLGGDDIGVRGGVDRDILNRVLSGV